MSRRAEALAQRLEQGARELADLAASLTDADWEVRLPGDGRTAGIVVHHVAAMYPLEIQLAQTLAEGQPIAGVTWDAVHEINATHAREHANVTREEAIELVRRNGALAAAAIRDLTDAQLDRAATISLYSDAPLSCQFFLEDHAVRHSFHHAAAIRRAVPGARAAEGVAA
ncbi:MAG TPA: DinB family protein [Gemmatimonadales bacterium]|jgi:hypothetical protein|nr:DinB family protein [Gemmatimonadales bacterium]